MMYLKIIIKNIIWIEKQSDRKIDLDENTFQEAEIAVMNIYTRHLIEKVDKINLE